MLYADDAGIALRSQLSVAKMMAAVVEVCAASGLVVAEKKTKPIHMHSPRMRADAVKLCAAGQGYKQVKYFVYLGGTINSIGNIGNVIPDPECRIGWARKCIVKYRRTLCVNPYLALPEKVRLLKAEVTEVIPYGCVAWALASDDFDPLQKAHRRFILRCLNEYTSTRSAPDYHTLSFRQVFERSGYEGIEANVMRQTILYADRIAQIRGEGLPNIVMRGEIMVGGEMKPVQPTKR
ncbi:unnamed protein product, partial [Sphacelaria rigidula]